MPMGNYQKEDFKNKYKSGDTETMCLFNSNPTYGVDCKIQAYVYDGDGNLIGESEVLVTKDKE